MAVEIDASACDACGTCVDSCPTEALSMVEEVVCINAETCIDCGVCVDGCPVHALSLEEA